jgi:hypothetical protein
MEVQVKQGMAELHKLRKYLANIKAICISTAGKVTVQKRFFFTVNVVKS